MRKAGLVILLFLTMLGVSGCVSKSYTTRREIKTYLENKYHSKFYYVSDDSPEDDLYSTLFTYKDEDGNKFYVTYYSSSFIYDGYGDILFREDVQELLQEAMGPDYVVHVREAKDRSGEPESYDSTLDYMQRCTRIDVRIYTKNEPDYTRIAQTLIDVEGDIYFWVEVYHTNEKGFAEAAASVYVNRSNQLSSEIFGIDGNQMIDYTNSGLFE